ncbi:MULTISPECIES: histidine phosphotransferase ChpT [Asticcacaulis]|uniref:histidine phosphotransferase ChpT n=1 Tax=Asticcacaulis TaxID=76890 RepID=UPI00247A38F9|nr:MULTISPECIES: histidine phosphotransferase family protein [Asticcacaulis]MBP2157833.1 histidine phosphotransferase ChpT [Asticcacaulis solisilvae]MDR6798878.1 histidine phosphotransferase ChpT [Asticcacaulis sp. BE141]
MDDLSPVLTPAATNEGMEAPAAETPAEAAAPEAQDLAGRHELATQMVAKLCHDFISPAGAIMSGLDLLEDPSAQDMKQEALNLISTSAKKLVSLVYFARVAFGAANTAEAFNAAQLNKILNDVYASLRAELDFRIEPNVIFEKPAARALLNLGLLAGNSLPMGGKMRLETSNEDGQLIITAEARGPRARLKPEVVEGLSGVPLSDGLAGQWIQPHWLYSVVAEAGGEISWVAETDILILTVKLPA